MEEVNRSARPQIALTAAEPPGWQQFFARINYVSLDATDAGAYSVLADALRQDPALTRVFYLAMPPNLFSNICQSTGTV